MKSVSLSEKIIIAVIVLTVLVVIAAKVFFAWRSADDRKRDVRENIRPEKQVVDQEEVINQQLLELDEIRNKAISGREIEQEESESKSMEDRVGKQMEELDKLRNEASKK